MAAEERSRVTSSSMLVGGRDTFHKHPGSRKFGNVLYHGSDNFNELVDISIPYHSILYRGLLIQDFVAPRNSI